MADASVTLDFHLFSDVLLLITGEPYKFSKFSWFHVTVSMILKVEVCDLIVSRKCLRSFIYLSITEGSEVMAKHLPSLASCEVFVGN